MDAHGFVKVSLLVMLSLKWEKCPFISTRQFPLLNRSGLLKKMISEFQSPDGKCCVLQLHDIPGGAQSFELVAKFCYDVKIELNALNVVSLRCAAEFLGMTEDCVGGNLILHTENFLYEVFDSWKDSIKALETCDEGILSQAEELHIVTRCINSLAVKACADPSLFGWPVVGRISMKSPEDSSSIPWNGICTLEKSVSSAGGGGGDWWYEDVSFLSLPLYKRLILAMDSKGMKPEYIAGSLMFYSRRFLPGLTRASSFREGPNRINPAAVSAPTESDQKVLLEEIVGLLPTKMGVTPTKFLLRLLRTAMILHASPSCRENLEKKVGSQLDEAALEDLLIPNLGYSMETLYDIDCFQRILDHFMLSDQSASAISTTSPGITTDERQLASSCLSLTPMTMVAKLVDGYLAEVAPDVNLKFPKFQSLAGVIPEYARPLDDGIYRAIDIYLKSHPWLTDSEREQLCRLMNCEKLSLEACTHAAQNERLPLRVVVQVLFFEQLRLRTSIAGWFFVSSDNNSRPHHHPHPHSHPHGEAHKNDLFPPTDDITIDDEKDNDHHQLLAVDEMRLRVSELERECSSMKQEIRKLGKQKTGWGFFSKRFGLGSKSHLL
ncbi:BTB/POZ domain-containing protein At5g03250-like isoform X2 [Asparagus officinalis]|uniref:BTB/POZ domain-containing protein At5g03250-like isoform X2 n=1 Tax=Asparagus officinalis TaxID=4686 RepID=UPI00098E7A89|nr:BTB/POZ domain-containing protein At5g03250-like isoform X2 [Asparagus officinalis]